MVPVFNHGHTVQQVVREAKSRFPVIVVNDGSTDETPNILAAETGITVVTFSSNQGKAAALGAGFDRAQELGFTHAITIDADGQHSTAELDAFAGACRREPEAFIIGVRDLKKEGAPCARRFSNAFSTFWFRWETGVPLTDTQCGYRCYPLQVLERLHVKAKRYAYELEVMVLAAWAGVPLVALPVTSDYGLPTSKRSHFQPWRDTIQISRAHSRLSMLAFCTPALLRQVMARGELRDLPKRQRVRTVLRHLFSEHTQTPGRLAAAVGLGLFCGIAPIWGWQMVVTALLAHRLRLNKAIALSASNISFPLAAPFILAAGLVLGHYLHTGLLIDLAPKAAARQIPVYIGEWFVGSVVLAVLVGALGMLAAYLAARIWRGRPAAMKGPPAAGSEGQAVTGPLVRLHLFLARHRVAVLLLLVLFAASSALLGQRLKLNEDFTDMLPMSVPAIAEQVEALKHIRQADRLFVDVQTTALEPERLTQAADQMHAALREIPELSDFRYNIEATDMREMFEQLQAQLPVLLNSNELHELEGRLQTPALEQRLAWMKKAMSQPQGLMLKEVAQTDPAGLGDVVSLRLRALQAGIGDAHIVAGHITSANGRHVLISAVPGFRPSELHQSAPLMSAVLSAARKVETQFPAGSVRIAITGAHRVALDNATMIREDSTRASVIATVAVALLMFAAYRRRWLALLGLAPTVFGVLGALLAFHFTGDVVSAIAIGCGSILIGVTVDYGIYVLYHLDDSLSATRLQLAQAVAQLAPALTFGALTTMAAFFVMFFSPVSGHRQLGLFGVVGVALAAGFALVVLPLFIPVGAAGGGRELPLTTVMQHLFDWRDRRARVVLPLLLLFSGLCVAGVVRLRFEGDLARLNGVTAATRRDDDLVREVWGKALSLTTVVVTGASREEALQKNEQVCAVLRTLQEQRAIDSFSSIAPLFPSEQTRQSNYRDWQKFWTEERRSDLGHSLASAAGSLGFRTNAFDPFLERLASTIPPPDSLAGAASSLDRLLSDYWSEQDGNVSICTLVKASDRQSFLRLREAVLKETPGALLLNKAVLTDEIARVAKSALPVFGVLVAVLNALLLFLLLGRLELVLITLLPMAAGVFWTLGTLGLLGLPIDMSNFIFVIFVIGVGGDYSLFMVMAELEPLRGYTKRTAATGGAVTICALTTLFGVGVLVLARHPALFSVGLTALLGISFSLLATLFLVPPCMRWIGTRSACGCSRRESALTSLKEKMNGLTSAAARIPSLSSKRKEVSRLYRYQGPYVTQFVYWKMKTDPLFQAVEAAAPTRGRILDLGCGYGIVAHWLTIFAPERSVTGVDFDADKIRVAQATARFNPRVVFERRDLLEWAEQPACDCVLLCDVLHYFPHELKADVLRKAFQALRPGGCLIVRDACAEETSRHGRVAWSEKWAVRFGQNKTRHGLHFESEATHLALLRQAGFDRIETRPDAGLGSNVLLLAIKPSNLDK